MKSDTPSYMKSGLNKKNEKFIRTKTYFYLESFVFILEKKIFVEIYIFKGLLLFSSFISI